MHKRIALLYDFDYTLSDGFMQEFGLMQDLFLLLSLSFIVTT